MDLTLERSELAILVLHLNIMRNPIKKGFKSNYGQFEGRKKLKEYDELKDKFQDKLSEEIDPVCFDLEDHEINMLHSFINWYVLELKLTFDQKANIENDEQLIILESINEKVTNMILEDSING